MSDRIKQAERVAESAERLLRLIELKAPELFIERERQILFQTLIKFPVDNDALEKSIKLDDEMDLDREDFLQKHDFYKDVDDLGFDNANNQGE